MIEVPKRLCTYLFYRGDFCFNCKINVLKPIIYIYFGRFSFTVEKCGLEKHCNFNVLKNVFIVALFLLIKIHIFERQSQDADCLSIIFFSITG